MVMQHFLFSTTAKKQTEKKILVKALYLHNLPIKLQIDDVGKKYPAIERF